MPVFFRVFLVIVGLFLGYVLSSQLSDDREKIAQPTMPNQLKRQIHDRNLAYTVVDETLSDKPFRTLITKSVVVSGIPTEAELESKLNDTYQAILAAAKGAHYYHEVPDVFIYIYGTEEQAQAGNLWLGMLAKTALDKTVDLRISESRLAALSKTPVQRFGLSLQERQTVFREFFAAEYKADCIALERHPMWIQPGVVPNTEEGLQKQANLLYELKEKFRAEIRNNYNLTVDQLQELILEGGQDGWVGPPLPECLK